MKSFKPYRTKAQKAQARATAFRAADGAWRSPAPFHIHGIKAEFVWGRNGTPVDKKTGVPVLGWPRG